MKNRPTKLIVHFRSSLRTPSQANLPFFRTTFTSRLKSQREHELLNPTIFIAALYFATFKRIHPGFIENNGFPSVTNGRVLFQKRKKTIRKDEKKKETRRGTQVIHRNEGTKEGIGLKSLYEFPFARDGTPGRPGIGILKVQ